jgi:Putative zinc-finger
MDITDSCLDAETLAAWVDGGLSKAELERAQVHVSDCARCQALMGTLARIESAAPVSVVEPTAGQAWMRWLTWLAPLTAAAVAVAVWVAVPTSVSHQTPLALPAPSGQRPAAEAKTKISEPAAHAAVSAEPAAAPAQAPAAEAAPMRAQDADRRADTSFRAEAELDSLKKQEASSLGAVAAAPPAEAQAAPAANAVAPAQAARLREMAAPLEIAPPGAGVRWRIAGTVLQRSSDAGATWETTATGVSTELTAGASPAPGVCWVVGRAGVVLLTIDGASWRRLPYPEITDLSSVRARDARSASVTTADGRIFSTSDAGLTWVPGPLQGF